MTNEVRATRKRKLALPPPAKTRLGRRPRLRDTHRHILSTAAEIFAASGYESSSMEEISVAVGSSKAAIYHYFDSKQTIYEAIIMESLEALQRRVADAVADANTPIAMMRAYVAAHIDYQFHNRAAVLVIVHSVSGQNRVIRDTETDLRLSFEDIIGDILRKGVADGSFHPVDILITQRAILGMLAWTSKWRHPGDGIEAGRVAECYLDMILTGLRNPADA